MSFRYSGSIPASKSILNRSLLVQSFFPDIKIHGKSDCDDVRFMKKAIVALIQKQDIDCGEAGAVFRFMAMRASRLAGAFRLKGSPRLLQRPQQELAFILNQLNVNVEFLSDGVLLRGDGWKKPLIPVRIPRERSSQFASGLLLSAWDLPFDLPMELAGHGVSEGYWKMSLEMVRGLGMEVDVRENHVVVSARQQPQVKDIQIEPDYSSMFAVIAAALVNGEVSIQGAGAQSLQPDHVFFDFLKRMGAPVALKNGVLHVQRAKVLNPLSASLKGCPDLFPVLAALCSFASGTSLLHEAPQLEHKESNRLQKTQELLRMAGVESAPKADGLEIHGEGPDFKPHGFVFDPDQDHRMAMAAALFRLREPTVGIKHIDVVKKSFPEFWSILGMV